MAAHAHLDGRPAGRLPHGPARTGRPRRYLADSNPVPVDGRPRPGTTLTLTTEGRNDLVHAHEKAREWMICTRHRIRLCDFASAQSRRSGWAKVIGPDSSGYDASPGYREAVAGPYWLVAGRAPAITGASGRGGGAVVPVGARGSGPHGAGCGRVPEDGAGACDRLEISSLSSGDQL
jgi:hypothetical protein